MFLLLGQVDTWRRLGLAKHLGCIRALFDALLEHLDNGRRLLIWLNLGLLRVLQVCEDAAE